MKTNKILLILCLISLLKIEMFLKGEDWITRGLVICLTLWLAVSAIYDASKWLKAYKEKEVKPEDHE